MSSLLAQTLLYPIPLFFVWPFCYLIYAALSYLLYDQIHVSDLHSPQTQSLVWPLYILSALMVLFLITLAFMKSTFLPLFPRDC
jgi:uncharacterized membrane protein